MSVGEIINVGKEKRVGQKQEQDAQAISRNVALAQTTPMFVFDIHDLPPELIPHILSHLQKPSHLAQACLVNRTFHLETIPLLYERVAIYAWHKDGKKKVRPLLFAKHHCLTSTVTKALTLIQTLGNNPFLAKLVRKLGGHSVTKFKRSSTKYQFIRDS